MTFVFSFSKQSGVERRILRLSATLRYGVLPEGSFGSPISSLQLIPAVAMDRRPAWLIAWAPRTHWLTMRAGVCHNIVRGKQPLMTCPRSFCIWWYRVSSTIPWEYVLNNLTTQPQQLTLDLKQNYCTVQKYNVIIDLTFLIAIHFDMINTDSAAMSNLREKRSSLSRCSIVN